jgi:DNA repair protein RAD5
LRRTKNSKGSDGKPIIELPVKTSRVELLTMSSKEREYYESIYSSSRSSFDELIEKGILEAKYMQVLEMLMRLRQICCHPILFKSVAKFTKSQKEF